MSDKEDKVVSDGNGENMVCRSSDVNNTVEVSDTDNSPRKKKVDPRSVPTQGVFYLHDDREDEKVTISNNKKSMKSVAAGKRNRSNKVSKTSNSRDDTDVWKHDKFEELEYDSEIKKPTRHRGESSLDNRKANESKQKYKTKSTVSVVTSSEGASLQNSESSKAPKEIEKYAKEGHPPNVASNAKFSRHKKSSKAMDDMETSGPVAGAVSTDKKQSLKVDTQSYAAIVGEKLKGKESDKDLKKVSTKTLSGDARKLCSLSSPSGNKSRFTTVPTASNTTSDAATVEASAVETTAPVTDALGATGKSKELLNMLHVPSTTESAPNANRESIVDREKSIKLNLAAKEFLPASPNPTHGHYTTAPHGVSSVPYKGDSGYVNCNGSKGYTTSAKSNMGYGAADSQVSDLYNKSQGNSNTRYDHQSMRFNGYQSVATSGRGPVRSVQGDMNFNATSNANYMHERSYSGGSNYSNPSNGNNYTSYVNSYVGGANNYVGDPSNYNMPSYNNGPSNYHGPSYNNGPKGYSSSYGMGANYGHVGSYTSGDHNTSNNYDMGQNAYSHSTSEYAYTGAYGSNGANNSTNNNRMSYNTEQSASKSLFKSENDGYLDANANSYQPPTSLE